MLVAGISSKTTGESVIMTVKLMSFTKPSQGFKLLPCVLHRNIPLHVFSGDTESLNWYMCVITRRFTEGKINSSPEVWYLVCECACEEKERECVCVSYSIGSEVNCCVPSVGIGLHFWFFCWEKFKFQKLNCLWKIWMKQHHEKPNSLHHTDPYIPQSSKCSCI